MRVMSNTERWLAPPMGRVLRAYDRASLAAVYKIDDAAATVRDIDDTIWAETEDAAYAEDAEYDRWKRQAQEELSDFEERLRSQALRSLYPLPSAAMFASSHKRHHAKPEVSVVPKLNLTGDGGGDDDDGDVGNTGNLGGGDGGGGGFGFMNDDDNAPPPPPPEKDKGEANE